MKKQGVTIGKTRNFLYMVARILGDINAIKHGKITERIMRRLAGKATGRILGKILPR